MHLKSAICGSRKFEDRTRQENVATRPVQTKTLGRKLAAKLQTKMSKSSISSSIDRTLLQCGYHENSGEVTVHYDPRRCGTGQVGRLMSRVYISPRDNTASKVKRWIRGNTKIGPALEEVAVSHHQARYGMEIMIESSVGDGTCSWVVIVNGINEYVTEMTEETQDDHIDYIRERTGILVAKATPKQISIPTTSASPTALPYHLRVEIDVEPGQYDKSCFEVSKKDDQIASTRQFSTSRRRRSS